MKYIVVTTHATGGAEIQDPFPADGRLVVDIPAGTTKSFYCNEPQYSRIKPQLDALVTAGILISVLISETDAERTDKFMETKKVAPPGPRTGYGRYFTGLDGNPYFETELGAVIMLAVAGGSAITFIGTIAVAGDFPLAGVAQPGWLYLMTGNATDPVTGASFTTDDEIIWNGTAWSLAGVKREQTIVDAATMGPIYTVLDADELLLVDVSAAPITLDFPTPVAKKYKRYELADALGNASANNITITVGGAPLAVIDVNGAVAAIESDGTNWIPVNNIGPVEQAVTHAVGTGMDHSSVTAHDNRLLAIGSGAELFEDRSQAVSAPGVTTVRSFRAVAAGAISALVAECGSIPGAGAPNESMTVDVNINGASACTAPAVLDPVTVPVAGTPVAAVINPVAAAYVAGDLIEIIYTYAAGSAPTPIVNTIADLEVVRG